MSKIYTVTTCYFNHKNIGELQLVTERCVGFYHDLERALECVENNWGDIHEGNFNYVVIEKIGDGLYPTVEEFLWFKWNDGKYEQSCVPLGFECVRGYGIG